MSRFRLGYWRTLERVTNLIELLISCHPQGFGVLLGDIEPPDSLMIHEMMNAGRVPMPEDFKPTTPSNETEAERITYDREYFDESVELAGGWAHINKTLRDYKNGALAEWKIVTDHTKFVKTSSSRLVSMLDYVAVRNKVSPTTVMRRVREFPQKVAEMLLSFRDDEEFCLLPY